MANWIAGAVKHPGAVIKAAKREGESVAQEAKDEANSPNKKIAARGRLALRFKGMAPKGNIPKPAAEKKSSSKSKMFKRA